MKKLLSSTFILLLCLCFAFAPFTALASEEQNVADYTDFNTYNVLESFVQAYPVRLAGTSDEVNAAAYLGSTLGSIGYTVSSQSFTFVNFQGLTATSQNVVAVKRSTSLSGKQVILGAHYDNVGLGEGAFDNGSGIAILLDLAQKIAEVNLPFDIVLVAFGAEEEGLCGSDYYVSRMSQPDKNSTLCMINFDSVAAGDNLYVYCEDVKTNYQSFFIEMSQTVLNGVEVKTKAPAKDVFLLNAFEGYSYYQTAQSSDHTSFRLEGIPTVFFYSGNYVLSNISYIESADNDDIMHTMQDSLSVLKEKYGISFVKKMETVSDTVFKTLTNENFSDIISSAREEMVDDIWFQTWLPCVIGLVILIAVIIFGISYLNKLNKKSILGVVQVKNEKFFEPTSSDDIFKF